MRPMPLSALFAQIQQLDGIGPKLAEKLAKAAGLKDYMMLYSVKEYKKTYKRYE